MHQQVPDSPTLTIPHVSRAFAQSPSKVGPRRARSSMGFAASHNQLPHSSNGSYIIQNGHDAHMTPTRMLADHDGGDEEGQDDLMPLTRPGGMPKIQRPTPTRSQSMRVAQPSQSLMPRPAQVMRQGSWNGQGLIDQDGNGTYPVRPHTTQPLNALPRYGSNGHSVMVGGTSSIPPSLLMQNQDPFAVGGHVMHTRDAQTVHMDDLVGQNGMNAFTPQQPRASVFGQHMNPEYEDEDDDRSTVSPAEKLVRAPSGTTAGLSTHPHSTVQQKDGASPTLTSTSRSLTPCSDPSYQPSIASVKSKKRVSAQMTSSRGYDQQSEDEDSDNDEDDEDDSSRGQRVAQVSPTRNGKGKDVKSTGSLKQSLLSNRTNKASAAGKKASKTESSSKSRDSARKPSTAGSAKAAAAEKENKPHVPEGLPPSPRSSEKPAWSYAALIGQAILSSSRKRLALNQIYAWISAAYPYFKPGEHGWMNSIRHNLSLNDCFIKGERNAEEKGGKGSVWMIEPALEFQFKDGGFKKQQKARQLAPTDPNHIGANNDPGSARSKKRKSVVEGDLRRVNSEHMDSPMTHRTPLMGPPQSSMNGERANVPLGALQCSPLAAEAPMSNKRPRSESTNAWATPAHPIPHARPDLSVAYRRPSVPYPGQSESEEESGLTREQIANLRRLTGSPMVSHTYPGAPSSQKHARLTDQGSPEDLRRQSHMSMAPPPLNMAARAAHNSSQVSGFSADDYTTPNRPLNPLHRPYLLSSSMGVPGLTPSASSPVSSSPYPATISKHSGVDRRSAHMHGSSDTDEVKIRREDDRLSSDPAGPDPIRKSLPSGLHPSPQIDGAFVVPAPPAKGQRPKTLPLDTSSMNNVPNENILSPIETRKSHQRVKSVSLPGPGDLLSQSPRISSERSTAPAADILGHLDKLPRSPIGLSHASSSSNHTFATPINPAIRRTVAGFTPRSTVLAQLTTPSRNGAGIPHETPIGNVKLQFKAEHRLLDSPMGLSGSCYDLANHGYQVDWELEHMANEMASRGSPTSSSMTVTGCRRVESEGVARTLFEVESGPFSDT